MVWLCGYVAMWLLVTGMVTGLLRDNTGALRKLRAIVQSSGVASCIGLSLFCFDQGYTRVSDRVVIVIVVVVVLFNV
ncbi:uncharacterized protein F4817DRAFT_128540 [Daldinia loculata]|uniref:uncharacterized protein n=1 Tax=Daldinia loculata TaxID=103429 RepID=UPI0020C517E5|nr:uncharacterized protein F4817DRAFT_128540 [Daldinia loculata]KAI1646676.1 hypothetical protein F4817DRAFT_128540 [Daldinia loculata]